MFNKKPAVVKRSTVTVEDRRAVLLAAKGRTNNQKLGVTDEQFIRNQLKDRMGWPHREPSPPTILSATREIVAVLHPKKMQATA